MGLESGIGSLRERIVIESATEAADSEGEPVKTWSTFATVWARSERLSGRELESLRRVYSEASIRFTIRYRSDMDESSLDAARKMRILWRSNYYMINAVLSTERRDYMFIPASKVA